jgi:hypothetical protein
MVYIPSDTLKQICSRPSLVLVSRQYAHVREMDDCYSIRAVIPPSQATGEMSSMMVHGLLCVIKIIPPLSLTHIHTRARANTQSSRCHVVFYVVCLILTSAALASFAVVESTYMHTYIHTYIHTCLSRVIQSKFYIEIFQIWKLKTVLPKSVLALRKRPQVEVVCTCTRPFPRLCMYT